MDFFKNMFGKGRRRLRALRSVKAKKGKKKKKTDDGIIEKDVLE